MHDELFGVALQIYVRYKHSLLNYTAPLDSITSGFDWGSNARVCHSGPRRAEPRQRAVQTVKYAVCSVSPFQIQHTSNEDYCFGCGFDRASSLICGNKMPSRCNR